MQKLIVIFITGGLLLGGTAFAQEEVNTTSPPLPMAEASGLMQTAKAECDIITSAKRRMAPACIAFETMQTAYWQSVVQQQQHVLTIAENQTLTGVYLSSAEVLAAQTTANVAAGVRDLAKIGDSIAYETQSNQLAEVRANGTLAEERVSNVLEAARAVDPVAQKVDVPALSEQIRDLSAYADSIWLALEESIAYQQGVCANNPNVSWCQ